MTKKIIKDKNIKIMNKKKTIKRMRGGARRLRRLGNWIKRRTKTKRKEKRVTDSILLTAPPTSTIVSDETMGISPNKSINWSPKNLGYAEGIKIPVSKSTPTNSKLPWEEGGNLTLYRKNPNSGKNAPNFSNTDIDLISSIDDDSGYIHQNLANMSFIGSTFSTNPQKRLKKYRKNPRIIHVSSYDANESDANESNITNAWKLPVSPRGHLPSTQPSQIKISNNSNSDNNLTKGINNLRLAIREKKNNNLTRGYGNAPKPSFINHQESLLLDAQVLQVESQLGYLQEKPPPNPNQLFVLEGQQELSQQLLDNQKRSKALERKRKKREANRGERASRKAKNKRNISNFSRENSSKKTPPLQLLPLPSFGPQRNTAAGGSRTLKKKKSKTRKNKNKTNTRNKKK